jgi:hypothetical protein
VRIFTIYFQSKTPVVLKNIMQLRYSDLDFFCIRCRRVRKYYFKRQCSLFGGGNSSPAATNFFCLDKIYLVPFETDSEGGNC